MPRKKRRTTDDTFFDRKKPWPQIKDTILSKYLHPYLVAVSKLRKPILIVDCFAGEGGFGPTNTPGSPLIICDRLERFSKQSYRAYFANRKPSSHQKLARLLQRYIDQGVAFPRLIDAQQLLQEIIREAHDQTLFVYMDPFGVKGLDFSTIAALLSRGTAFSTEILINLNMPLLHRYGTKDNSSPTMAAFRHTLLTDVLGGEYWKDILWDDSYSPEEQDNLIVEEYQNALRTLLPYVGSCPVRERATSQLKYFTVHCSRHPLAYELMNDIMCDAYHEYMHSMSLHDMPLFAPTMQSWEDSHSEKVKSSLQTLILESIQSIPGIGRRELWRSIIEKEFMKYRSSEFKGLIQLLFDQELIETLPQGTGSPLNDQSKLSIKT